MDNDSEYSYEKFSSENDKSPTVISRFSKISFKNGN